MLGSLLDFLRCGSQLDLDVFEIDQEIQEEILECKKCKLIFQLLRKYLFYGIILPNIFQIVKFWADNSINQ